MGRESLEPWRAALVFHLRHALSLVPIAPLLCLPIYTDVLHTVLIKQSRGGSLRPRAAAAEALRALPMTVWLKWGSELRAVLWSLIPLVFFMRVIETACAGAWRRTSSSSRAAATRTPTSGAWIWRAPATISACAPCSRCRSSSSRCRPSPPTSPARRG